MKNTLVALAFVLASALAFAIGNISAARSAGDDLTSALGRDGQTGLAYLRVYVVNSGSSSSAVATIGAPVSHIVTLSEGSSTPLDGTLLSATAVDRPCDLILFENGQSRIILASTSGTQLKGVRIAGTVSATGNPLGYTCSIVLRFTTP